MLKVIDNSVAIKWLFEEPGRESALDIYADVVYHPEDYAVPELFYYELTNVFYRLITQPDRIQLLLLEDIVNLPWQRIPMTHELILETGSIQKSGLTAYDASYAAIAYLYQGQWITFDKKAAKKIKDKVHVQVLG